jgi:hypothetical protein
VKSGTDRSGLKLQTAPLKQRPEGAAGRAAKPVRMMRGKKAARAAPMS